jgi:ACS family tartrate transporter-like MFS transporter
MTEPKSHHVDFSCTECVQRCRRAYHDVRRAARCTLQRGFHQPIYPLKPLGQWLELVNVRANRLLASLGRDARGMTSRNMESFDLERRTIAKVSARLVPFLITCYFVAYLDRVNVGFAALTMNTDLGLSASAFGFGAGVFFLTYFLFEVPSNLFLERVGARSWIARIMFTWGVVSGATAFIVGETSFYVVRVLLGIAEAGFFPGIIFFLTLWFPAMYRARIIGYFMAAIPLSTVIGAPLSGLLLQLDGFMGLKGWQWLFIVEAVPAVILSVVVFFYLTDRPADATWLEPDERAWLVARLRVEQAKRETVRRYTVKEALLNLKVLALSFVYFGAVATNYGLSFFLPQIVKAFGVSNLQAGLITALPYIVGAIGIVWWGRHSDRTLERRFHLALPLFVASAGIAVSTALDDPAMKMVALSIAGFGIFGCLPVFWTLPTAFLGGAAAAGGIALINSIGNLAGFVGPYAVGRVKDMTGSYTGGLLSLSVVGFAAAIIVLALEHDHSLEVVSGRSGEELSEMQ